MATPTLTPEPALAVELRRSGRPWRERIFEVAIRLCVIVTLGCLGTLLVFLVYNGWSRLDLRLWENMPTSRISRVDTSGIRSAITGTLWVTVTTAVIALPLGVAAAVYLEEYADRRRWYNRLIELNIQNLAGVPSIVFGILGLGVIARWFGLGFTVLTAGITLALLIAPTVIIASREAIRAVPPSIRDASAALGATRWQTTYRQVLPAAVPGIATGAILGVSRAVGEAAPLLMLGAATLVLFDPTGLDSTYTTLPIQIYSLVRSPFSEMHEIAAAAIVVLLGIVLALNAVAIWIRHRFGRKW